VLILALIWCAVGIGFALVSRRSSAGFPLAYFLGLSVIHVPGALLYLGITDVSLYASDTRVGFEQTVIGMVAFLCAVTIVRYRAFARRPGRRTLLEAPLVLSRDQTVAADRWALTYLSLGGIANFLLMPLFGDVATITAVISSMGALMVVGLCLRLWVARQTRNPVKFWSTLILLPLLPVSGLVQSGFVSFGTYWILAILAFVFCQSKRRFTYVLMAPAVIYIGLSAFVSYMGTRSEIRGIVWNKNYTALSDRIEPVEAAFARGLAWFDPSNPRHRGAIAARLNQNWLTGTAARRFDSGQQEYARGATFGAMVMGLIPRAVWPEKPQVGGGGSVVHDFTGINFARGISVGAGQVFEFYVNFGILGVIGGFLLYGWLIGRMDLSAIESLCRGDHGRFCFWLLICVPLLRAEGNLLEIEVSAAAAAIAAYGLGFVFTELRQLLDRRRRANEIGSFPRATLQEPRSSAIPIGVGKEKPALSNQNPALR
jgi:hypothetical protein